MSILRDFSAVDAFHIALLVGMVGVMSIIEAGIGAQALAVGVYIVGREAEDYEQNRDLNDSLRDAFWLAVGGYGAILVEWLIAIL